MFTDDELENFLNPQGSATKFRVASYKTLVDRERENASAIVKSCLREQYRRMINCHSGIVLSLKANEGQVIFPLPTTFTYLSGLVWKNHQGVWSDRKKDKAIVVDIVDGNAVLPEPAKSGDSYIGDFVPTGDEVPFLLKNLALKLCGNAICRTVRTLVADLDSSSLDNELIFLREDLRLLRTGSLGVDEWDELYKDMIK